MRIVAVTKQYITAILLVLAVALLCLPFKNFLGYHAVALLLLLAVSLTAMRFKIFPVLVAAALSALLLNFLYIPPTLTFHISTTEDVLLFLIYFIIAVVNAVFTMKIRREERKTRERTERRNALKLYTTLFNSLSHELKTPIATIIGSAETLKNSNLSKENSNALFDEIGLAGERLHRQVENLLNMSRLESGMISLKRDWTDINEMLHTAALQEKTNTHIIKVIDNESLPLFKIDEGLVQQAMHNIIHNAIAYTQAGSTIKLYAKQENESCCIIISDNGPGLPDDALHMIFDKFYRLPGTRAGGTGLGLSIAKGFAEAHDGGITAENDDGAKFTIMLPAEVSHINKLKNE
jgi:two-component system, OmpR family, sensor histidine kinase KdpD